MFLKKIPSIAIDKSCENNGFFTSNRYFFVTKRHSQASDIVVTGVIICQFVLVDVSSLFIETCDFKRTFVLRRS
jgi:hypothetical protein